MNNKPRYCKCGHLSHPTHDTQKSFLGIKYKSRLGCNGMVKINETTTKCNCKRFLIENYPTKFDSVLNYLVFGVLLFIIIVDGISSYAIYNVANCTDPVCVKALSIKVFTEKQVLVIILLVFIIMISWFVGLISDFFKQDRLWKAREKREHQE